ncbi:MAG: iron-sulfur cluster assembly accessory protein [Patescibacteria group bacterium]|nr:iron-sulfur cluster assembly accessory protein [Patescibacteria group bacterium]
MDFKITLTSKAASELKKMQKEEKKIGYGLKFDIFPAGCMGFQYYLDFAKEAEKEESETESEGVKIFVPTESIPLVNDCKIDYIEDDEGFKIDNPNISSGCGGSCSSCSGCGG